MMPQLRVSALAVAGLLLAASRGAADDSVFGIRGLGLLGRPVSARSASAGGGFALFDAAASLNPAALGLWRRVAGWAVAAPSRRQFGIGTETASLTSTRFPLFGFATVLGQRLVLGVSISDYLDRTWSVRTLDTITLRDTAVTVEDLATSVGGVSDLRLAAAYRLSPTVLIGAGVHALTGSTRLTVRRDFSSGAYRDFADVAVTDFRGLGLSAGVLAAVRPGLAVAGRIRVNSDLEARSTGGRRASAALPIEFAAGAQFTPTAGVVLASTVGYATWSRAAGDLAAAGQPRSRNVWSVGAGIEVETITLGPSRLPLRFGYGWRQLPFPVGGDALSESAVSAGVGINLAGGRAIADLGVERGSRTAAGARERFTTGFVGITVRP